MIKQVKESNSTQQKIHSIKHWIVCHITHPIQGFEHKTNSDGTVYTPEQQISATQYQVMNIADYFLTHGKSYEDTLKVIKVFVK